MTTPLNLPANHEDSIELEQRGGRASDEEKPVTGSPSGKMMGVTSVSEAGRLSTISEHEPDKMDADASSHGARAGSEWGGSSFSMCSDRLKNSGSCFSSDDSYQPDTGDDCAALLLACLHCRFHELMVLLPDTYERAVSRCFPSYRYVRASSERDQPGKDCCNFKLDLDCNCCGSCQDTGELIELAMEISEVCYR